MFSSILDLMVVGNKRKMTMMAGNGRQIREEQFIEALEFGQQQIQPIIAAQTKLSETVGKRKRQFERVLPKVKIVTFCITFEDQLTYAVFQNENWKGKMLSWRLGRKPKLPESKD
jgi:polyribonucleotide nucleotidyltransferase